LKFVNFGRESGKEFSSEMVTKMDWIQTMLA
jgi:hypothetical protein